MVVQTSIDQWQQRLDAAMADEGGLFSHARVVAETDSTQADVKRLGASGGEVVVAGRQTAGRGRLGRSWADTGEEGAACTFVVEAARMPADERLAIAVAVGVAGAVEPILGCRVGIKWPNDIVIDGRKLAGILIEVQEGLVLIGIGINVLQTQWPAELSGIAVSLAELGIEADRLAVLESLMQSMDRTLRTDVADIERAFAERDGLVGTTATFRIGNEVIAGTVERIDPMRGLVVRTGTGEDRWLPAAITTVEPKPPADR